VSLSLQAGAIGMNNNVSAELEAEGVVDKNNMEETEAIIKEVV